MSQFLTPAQLAERWACSPRHVRRLCQRGDLRAMRLGLDAWRISVEAVEAYERGHTTGGAGSETSNEGQKEEVKQFVTAVAGLSLPADYVPVFPDLWEGNGKAPSVRT